MTYIDPSIVCAYDIVAKGRNVFFDWNLGIDVCAISKTLRAEATSLLAPTPGERLLAVAKFAASREDSKLNREMMASISFAVTNAGYISMKALWPSRPRRSSEKFYNDALC